jgi:hypothetical protein
VRTVVNRNAGPARPVSGGVLKSRATIFLTLLTLAAPAAFAGDARMPLSEVHKGMKGYGVTVFEGTKLEKFDVEIVGVLNNIAPGQDLILANIDGPVVRRAGVIAGMSGSPIYIDGKVIGALSYGWQFSKEPLAGITPIDEMLQMPRAGGAAGNMANAAAPRFTGAEFLKALGEGKSEALFESMAGKMWGAHPAAVSGAKPIAIPLSLGGFAPETVERFGKYLDGMGFMTVPMGSTTGAASTKPATNKPFAPGDPIGAVLLSGDFTLAATGTVTHVDGDRVWAFGHPFLDMGEVSFPMAQSEIVTVMPSLASSFKFANTGAIVGSLEQDRAVGISGVVGQKAQMIPLELTVDSSGPSHTYHVQIVRHPQLSPLILAMAADTVVTSAQRGAGERTVLLDSEIKLKGFAEPIHLREGWAGAQARQAIPAYLAVVAQYVMSNEFRDAEVENIKIRLHHDDNLKIAKLLEASLETPEKGRVSAGDTVKVRTVLKPFRGEPFVETFDVKIPDNQPAGAAYLLVGSGSLVNQVDFSLVPPDPRSLDQVIAVLQRLRPSTDLTLGLYSATDGAVTAGVYLPNLPPTMRAVVTGDTTNGAQAPVRYHSTDHVARSLGYIVDGALKIDVDVKPQI